MITSYMMNNSSLVVVNSKVVKLYVATAGLQENGAVFYPKLIFIPKLYYSQLICISITSSLRRTDCVLILTMYLYSRIS